MLCAFINRECDGDCVAYDKEIGCTRLSDENAFREELIAALDRINDVICDIDIAPQ